MAALNIHRGYDHGIGSYNDLRKNAGLDAVETFAEITSNVELQVKLQAAYGTVDAIDPWIGALSEDHVAGAAVGELVGTILKMQFTNLMLGDKFFYKFDPDLEDFKGSKMAGVIDLDTVGLADVIKSNTVLNWIGSDSDGVFFA